MRLKKRTAKARKQGIRWETVLAFGVKDTKESRERFLNGEALDLMLEVEDEPQEPIINHDPVSNIVDISAWAEEQTKLEDEAYNRFLNKSEEDTDE